MAFRFMVKETNASADCRAVVVERRIGKTEARPEQVLCIVETTRCTCRHRQNGRTISVGYADELVCRHAVACPDQPFNSIAALRGVNRPAAYGTRAGLY